MRIGIVGAGGAGGYFAGRWCEAGLDVTLLARGGHFEAIRDHGLRVLSPRGDITAWPNVVDQAEALAGLDVVVFATKTWQLPSALATAAPFVSDGTIVFGLQNGVEVADLLADALPGARILGATCRIISYIDDPGVIRHVGAEPTIKFGGWSEPMAAPLVALSELLTVERKVTVTHSPAIVVEVWRKFMFFAPFSGIGAMYDRPIGETRSDPAMREQLSAAILEVAAVASAHGVELGSDVVAQTLAFVDQLPPEGTSSLQRDFSAGRPTELASLSGRVVEMGAELGVATPTHAKIVDCLTSA